jgi:hypothetical protein
MAGTTKQKLQAASKTRVRPRRKKPGRSGCAVKGVKILREAAGKKVGENSGKIAQSLLDGALGGDVNSAKLLLSLAELEPEQEDAGNPQLGWSLALALAAEPEWQEPVIEASAETRGGSREPEG